MDNFESLVESIFQITDEPPSLADLERIASRFTLIPYENLTKIIRAAENSSRESLLRDPMCVLSEYNQFGAGGTCFSLTHCLKTILDKRGYLSAPRMADLGRQTNNHCALVVVFDSREFLIDPGYLITSPLPIPEAGTVLHPTRLYPVRLERETGGDALHLSTLEPDGEKSRYRLHPTPVSPEEFRAYWLASFSWTMMNSLLVTQAIPDGRFYMHDRHLRWYHSQGRESKKVGSEYDLTVAHETGIDVTIVKQARLILAQHKRKLQE